MRTNNPFVLGLGKHVHHALVTLSPIRFGHAMHQADIEIVDPKLPAKAVQISSCSRRIARLRLTHHRNFVPRHMLQRLRDMRMAAIRIRRVKETQPVIVAVQQQVRESLDPKRSLV